MSIRDQYTGTLGGGIGITGSGLAQRFYEQQGKDPSVNNAQEAVHALEKRRAWLKSQLAQVESWEKELARVEAMIAAAGVGP